LDPGLDHMSALQFIHDVQRQGGKVVSYRSMCGGLPSPECAANPLRYKFSWNPRGVLTAGKNSARYLENSKEIQVEGRHLFRAVSPVHIPPCFSMEVLPNRDSISYIPSYGLEGAETVFRGTLRYQGFSSIMRCFVDMGLLDETENPALNPDSPLINTWPDFIALLIGDGATKENLKEKILSKYFDSTHSSSEKQRVIKAMQWYGMFDVETEFNAKGNALDTLCDLLTRQMMFGQHEHDMVLLQHEFGIITADSVKEKHTMTLIAYGQEGASAMSRTVGIPVAIAAELILEGAVKERGVIAPVTEEIYKPLLQRLVEYGLEFTESIQ